MTVFPLPSHAVDQIEEQERHQRKHQDEQEGIEVPQVGHVDIAIIRNCRERREHLLIGQAVDHGASQKAE